MSGRNRACYMCKRYTRAEDITGMGACVGCHFDLLVSLGRKPETVLSYYRCDRCNARFPTRGRPQHDRCASCASSGNGFDTLLCRFCGYRFQREKRRGIKRCRQLTCPGTDLRSARMTEARRKGTHTADEWARLVEEFGGRCAYCKREGNMTKDHVRPISHGGSDAIANIVPACLSCNASKGDRSLDEWRRVEEPA